MVFMSNTLKQNVLFTWEGFNSLDETKQFSFLKGSLEAMDAQKSNQRIQKNIIHKMELQSGQKISEVGCGFGQRAKRLSAVNPDVFITAVDVSEKLLNIAKIKNSAENITYQLANVDQLPFSDNSFDIFTAERLLICFKDALPALKEMVRVLKPGGKLVVTDFNPASIIISPTDNNVSALFMKSYLPSFNDPYIGRKLPEFFQKSGLIELKIYTDISEEKNMNQLEKIIPMKDVLDGGVRAGFLLQSQATDWLTRLRQASKESYFLYVITVVSVIAEKAK